MKKLLLATAFIPAITFAQVSVEDLDVILDDGILYCQNVSGLGMDANTARYDGYSVTESINVLTEYWPEFDRELISHAVRTVYTTQTYESNQWARDFQTSQLGNQLYDNCITQINAIYIIERNKIEQR